MDPVALWDQIVEQAVKILQLTDAIAKNEEREMPPTEQDWAELHDEADSLAMDVTNLDEWISKGGFSPFEKGTDV